MNTIATLERACGYAMGCLALVRGTSPGAPTPCRDWDLADLLAHLDDSCAALGEAVQGGVLPPPRTGLDDVLPARLAQRVAARARHALGEWIAVGDRHEVAVGDCLLPARAVVAVGALELAVHGWDVARACGEDRPIPAELAEDLLTLAAVLVTDEDRPARFATALPGPGAPHDALLAHLGRPANAPLLS